MTASAPLARALAKRSGRFDLEDAVPLDAKDTARTGQGLGKALGAVARHKQKAARQRKAGWP